MLSLSHLILSVYPVVMAYCTGSCYKQSQTFFLNQLFLNVKSVRSCLLFKEPAVCRKQLHMGRKWLYTGFYSLLRSDIICINERAHMECWVALRGRKTQKLKSSQPSQLSEKYNVENPVQILWFTPNNLSPREFVTKSSSGNELQSLGASLHHYTLCRQRIFE